MTRSNRAYVLVCFLMILLSIALLILVEQRVFNRFLSEGDGFWIEIIAATGIPFFLMLILVHMFFHKPQESSVSQPVSTRRRTVIAIMFFIAIVILVLAIFGPILTLT